ncbi:MAG: flagellar biosynthesis protein FlhA [Firmicutes bacterium]|nr:flagellar biosynthesis protein FlhA [Bacillota bacterium]
MKFSDVSVSIIILLVILLIIVPLNTVLLDVLLMINIMCSVIILLMTLYTKQPLEFSVFPPLLLIVTLFRLALNISATRLILGNGGEAGNVIKTFGGFVIGGNLVVGLIIFIIIVLIQFIVITKGSERVAEVAARFTLDAMPGKQMAIDADLNTGLISEEQAKHRRLKIQRESDFYGAMDGASKFVKGDAIVAIIITVINIVGGIIIGSLGSGIPLEKVVGIYTLATIGNGLVSQLPALLVSTASGIIVTRVDSDNDLGGDLNKQLASQPLVLITGGAMMLLINFIPGLPKIPIFILGLGILALGYSLLRAGISSAAKSEEQNLEEAAAQARKPENVLSLLQVELIEIEFGYSIIPLADANKGGDLLDRVIMIRRQCALDLGIIIPSIRLRDNIQLEPNEYVIKIKGVEVARGIVMVSQYLALNTNNSPEELEGTPTVEAAFGLAATWIDEKEREKAEVLGYTLVDPPTVIATHLTEIIKKYGYELMGRQQVQTLIDNVRETNPALIDEVVPKLVTVGTLQKVLANLLRENVSIRDMVTIIETLVDYSPTVHDVDMLTEYVRQSLKRAITKRFVPENIARVITVDPTLEQMIIDNIQQTENSSYVSIEPQKLQEMFESLKTAVEKMVSLGISPIVLTAPVVRYHFKRLTDQMVPDLTVLSFNELESDVEIQTDSVVAI